MSYTNWGTHELEEMARDNEQLIADFIKPSIDIDFEFVEALSKSITERVYLQMKERGWQPDCKHKWGKVHKRWWTLWQECQKCGRARKVKYEES